MSDARPKPRATSSHAFDERMPSIKSQPPRSPGCASSVRLAFCPHLAQLNQPRISSTKPALAIEGAQVRLEVDVQPFGARFARFNCTASNDLFADSLPAKLRMH